MKSCIYCKRQYKKSSGVSFHRFPRDLKDRNLWLQSMKLTNWTPKTYNTLCSLHFADECFDIHFNRKSLKPGSIPTIFEEFGRPKEVPSDDRTDYPEVYLNDANAEPVTIKIEAEEDKINGAPARVKEEPIDDQTDHNYPEVCLNDANTEPVMIKIEAEEENINGGVVVKSEPDSDSDEQEVMKGSATVQPARDESLLTDIKKEECVEGYESVIPAVDAFSVALFLLENPGYTGGLVSSWAARGAGAVTVCGAPEPAPRGLTLQCRCGDVPVRCALTEGVAPALSCACGAACCDHCLLVLLYLHRATCPTPPLPPPLPTLPT